MSEHSIHDVTVVDAGVEDAEDANQNWKVWFETEAGNKYDGLDAENAFGIRALYDDKREAEKTATYLTKNEDPPY